VILLIVGEWLAERKSAFDMHVIGDVVLNESRRAPPKELKKT